MFSNDATPRTPIRRSGSVRRSLGTPRPSPRPAGSRAATPFGGTDVGSPAPSSTLQVRYGGADGGAGYGGKYPATFLVRNDMHAVSPWSDLPVEVQQLLAASGAFHFLSYVFFLKRFEGVYVSYSTDPYSDAFRAEISITTGFAMLLSRDNCYVWSGCSSSTSKLFRIFAKQNSVQINLDFLERNRSADKRFASVPAIIGVGSCSSSFCTPASRGIHTVCQSRTRYHHSICHRRRPLLVCHQYGMVRSRSIQLHSTGVGAWRSHSPGALLGSEFRLCSAVTRGDR